MATLGRDGPARHRAARVARRACRRGHRPRTAASLGWVGGARNIADRRPRVARRPRRALAATISLLPALHAVQGRIGWISQPALNYICEAACRAARRGLRRRDVLRALCDQAAAAGRGPRLRRHRVPARRCGADLRATSSEAVGPAGRRRPATDRSTWLRSPCLGLCDLAPAAMMTTVAGEDRRDVVSVGARSMRAGSPSARLDGSDAGRASPERRRSAARPRRHDPIAAACGAIGVVDPPPSTTTGRTAATRALAKAIEIGPEAVIAEVTASKLDGSRRRGLPDGSQVGRRRGPARPAPLPRLQRRRVRARHVQGPRPPRGRPVRDRRGDDDRRLRDRCRATATSTSAASTRKRRRAIARRDRARARGRPARGRHPGLGLRASTSSSGAAPAPTSAARRRRCSSRSRASAASRATSRRSRSRSGCSASRRSSTTSRRWPTCR